MHPILLQSLSSDSFKVFLILTCIFLYVKVEDIHYVGFLSKLLETRIMQVLCFKYGQVEFSFLNTYLRVQMVDP
jgi:hypothetical protein